MAANGSNRTRRKSSSSIMSLFKSCCSGGGDEAYSWEADTGYVRRIYASDEDGGYWVAEPGIDRRADAFIARFHNNSHL